MKQTARIARTFLLTLVVLVVLCVLVRLWRGPGLPGVMRAMPEGRGAMSGARDAISAGISDGLWAIMVTFLLSIGLGVALMISTQQLALQAVGSVLLGVAAAMGMMYAIEVAAFPWNTYDVGWDDLIDFWGLFFGAFAGLSVFGLAHAWATRRHFGGSIGLVVIGLALGVLGLLTLLWAAAWGLSLLTLEGAWIYPLGFFSLLFSFLAFRGAHRRRRHGALSPEG